MSISQRSGSTYNDNIPVRSLKPHPLYSKATTFTNYTLSNSTTIPAGVLEKLTLLKTEHRNKEITLKGFLRQQEVLLKPFAHLPGVARNLVTYSNAKNSTGFKNSIKDTTLQADMLQEPVNNGGAIFKGAFRTLFAKDDTLERGHLPWERQGVFPETHPQDSARIPTRRGRRLLDTFADSLRHVNKLYTRAYGHAVRKVPAHMPHMINREIMQELQDRWAETLEI